MAFGVIDLLSLSQGGVTGFSIYEGISYPLSLPSVGGIRSITLSARNVCTVTRSPFTLKSQIQEYAGHLWMADVRLIPMERADAEEWICFLLKLNGQRGTFLMGDTPGKQPRGSAGGDPQVAGAGQSGQTLMIDGLEISENYVLRAGDYFQIGQRLYKQLLDVHSDANGAATLDFWPRLRETPADNEDITFVDAKGLFRLTTNDPTVHSVDEGKIYEIQFSAIEAF